MAHRPKRQTSRGERQLAGHARGVTEVGGIAGAPGEGLHARARRREQGDRDPGLDVDSDQRLAQQLANRLRQAATMCAPTCAVTSAYDGTAPTRAFPADLGQALSHRTSGLGSSFVGAGCERGRPCRRPAGGAAPSAVSVPA